MKSVRGDRQTPGTKLSRCLTSSGLGPLLLPADRTLIDQRGSHLKRLIGGSGPARAAMGVDGCRIAGHAGRTECRPAYGSLWEAEDGRAFDAVAPVLRSSSCRLPDRPRSPAPRACPGTSTRR